jgi:hypothetical protein
MGLKDIVNKVKEGVGMLKGDETTDKLYTNENTFPDEVTAIKEFERAKEKLFNVNLWSNLEGFSSTFELYDDYGRRTTAHKPKVGYYMRIILPAPVIENWVQISRVAEEENMAEFVVHPSEKPKELTNEEDVIEHFFIKEASSTFRVERKGNKLIGSEIGKNEGINNQGEEAGDRAVLNTLIAGGGWAGIQALQWDKVTSYFVHLEEASEEE